MPRAAVVVAVAATERAVRDHPRPADSSAMARVAGPGGWRLAGVCSVLVAVCLVKSATAATLPADRADAMYHLYDGGGLEVQGPSVLVRKGYADKVSAWANYYVDAVSSASIDVMSSASPYSESRKEWSAGVDALHEKTTFGIAWTQSEESDYSGETARFGVSQDFFGDLTTVGLSYAVGSDEVRRNGDSAFVDDVDRRAWRVDVAQVLTRNLVMNLNYETVSEEGFLNNPYRVVRFVDQSQRGFGFQPEVYPRTRTSNALALRGRYYLPYRAAVALEGRGYRDSFGIDGRDVEVSYTHPLGAHWMLEARVRYYSQTAADFYSDLFARRDAQNFLARDKELATFDSRSFGAGVAWEFSLPVAWMPRGSLNLQVDYMQFAYDDFRDVLAGGAPGAEPQYSFNALVVRSFLSLWF